MNERLLENWLDSTNELTLQSPFCHILEYHGYTILQSTRHGPMEMGKDIIAVNPEGIPCAFQLKSSANRRISLSEYREKIQPQLLDLTTGTIVHPSIVENRPHQSFLVTNRNFEEEVTRSIDDFNRGQASAGRPGCRVHTMVRGQVLDMAKETGQGLWPAELKDVKSLLEVFLSKGNEMLPRDKIGSIIETTMPLTTADSLGVRELDRLLSSTALLTAISLSPFSTRQNHAAEVEGWTLYWAYAQLALERWSNEREEPHSSVTLARQAITDSLYALCEDMRNRTHYVEGDGTADIVAYPVRITHLLGLMSLYGLWQLLDGTIRTSDHLEFARGFSLANYQKAFLWGEGAIPSILSLYWFLKTTDGSPRPDGMLGRMIRQISQMGHSDGPSLLPNAYLEVEEARSRTLGLTVDENPESAGSSYYLEGLVHLLAKRLWKQSLKSCWPDISYMTSLTFRPASDWEFYRRRAGRGSNVSIPMPLTKAWNALYAEAVEHEGRDLPPTARRDPIMLLAFLMVYPYRASSGIIRWLDHQLATETRSCRYRQ